MSQTTPSLSFSDLNLPDRLVAALDKIGYESPSPIQAQTIPCLLDGRDVVGLAQTGTGKTAAFALPILANIDLKKHVPQALILCPTRELAIQVAEAFQSYASKMRNFHVLPLYGGQDMRGQLRGLQRGAHVIVGTPGRLLDHLQRRSLNLSELKTLVLDEADEMLRMGFIDDVESILENTPKERQIALFSATMPAPIRRVADRYLHSPKEIRIEAAVTTNENIEQFCWTVQGTNKLDALTRILEVEDFDGMIIFVRTKTATTELADKLNARGFSASPLNGDMNQALRQRTVEKLKAGTLDILVATDVAARGLDVERISHVVNYDIPYDEEAYVHRIGRTGRAGRKGKAILFVAPRERRLLRAIEKTTRKKIDALTLPSHSDLIEKRAQDFKDSVAKIIGTSEGVEFKRIVSELCEEQKVTADEVASAMVYLLQKNRPLIPPAEKSTHSRKGDPKKQREPSRKRRDKGKETVDMETYRIAVGKNDDVTPREIVGAIANEAGLDGCYIGQIEILSEHTHVDLPVGMPKDIFHLLKKTRVKSKKLNIERVEGKDAKTGDRPKFSKSTKPRHKQRSKGNGKGRDHQQPC